MLGEFEQRTTQSILLQKTEKLLISDGNETLIALTATYVNTQQSLELNTTHESFIIGIYSATDDEIAPNDLNLTLNLTQPLEVVKLESGDAILKGLPSINQWFVYYHLTFPHIAQKGKIPLQINFTDPQTGEPKTIILPFSKVAKYL